MPVFETHDQAALLGVSPIAHVSDEEIFRHLVTPTVKGLLGQINKRGETRVLETRQGIFPGDEATNLNGHLLAVGPNQHSAAVVRFPYRHTIYRTERGAIVVKADGVKFEVFCWFGNVDKGRAELVLKAALRDRRYDGTWRANDSALLDYTYDHPVRHQRLSDTLSSVELSIYGFMPASRAVDATGDKDYDAFLQNPFRYLQDADKFLEHFERAFKSKHAPGQFARPVPDVSQFALKGFDTIARKHGYDLIEMAASHYHVAMWAVDGGFAYSDPAQEKIVARLTAGLEKIRATGQPLTRTQQSWACVIQSLRPADRIPAGLSMGRSDNGHETDLQWPQNNLDETCLWLYKPLSERARGFKPRVCFNPEVCQAQKIA